MHVFGDDGVVDHDDAKVVRPRPEVQKDLHIEILEAARVDTVQQRHLQVGARDDVKEDHQQYHLVEVPDDEAEQGGDGILRNDAVEEVPRENDAHAWEEDHHDGAEEARDDEPVVVVEVHSGDGGADHGGNEAVVVADDDTPHTDSQPHTLETRTALLVGNNGVH